MECFLIQTLVLPKTWRVLLKWRETYIRSFLLWEPSSKTFTVCDLTLLEELSPWHNPPTLPYPTVPGFSSPWRQYPDGSISLVLHSVHTYLAWRTSGLTAKCTDFLQLRSTYSSIKFSTNSLRVSFIILPRQPRCNNRTAFFLYE